MEKIQLDLFNAGTGDKAMGGGLEGASRISREMALWSPPILSPDQMINPSKEIVDARGRDIVTSDGYAMGAVNTYKDSIVGHSYRLNAQPNYLVIGADQGWAEEFQRVVEARFNLVAESESCWLDASGKNTFTGMVRLALGQNIITGETLATSEWKNERNRPFKTAFQIISPDRLCNPDGNADDEVWRRGIKHDKWGKAIMYAIRRSYQSEWYSSKDWTWRHVPAEKPWGRKQVIHIIEQILPGQSRGISEMVSVLKQMRMTKRFQEITLQNAVINASFAAAIESELPPDIVYESMGGQGGGKGGFISAIASYMSALQGYITDASSIHIDGAKIPHLFPGTKLNMLPMGQPGGVGTSYEESLMRNIAAGLSLSYEEFSKDFSKTNYSSARASMASTWRGMQSKKKNVADRFATIIYSNWLEEEIAAGNVPMPKGKGRDHFYAPLMREAYTSCSWIGASRGQIDELKETQAAILRIKSGLSTYEIESSKMGSDFREIFEQRAREEGLIKAHGLSFSLDAQREGKAMAQGTMTEKQKKGKDDADTDEDDE